MQRKGDTKRGLLCTSSSPECPQQPGLGKQKPETRNGIQVSYMGGRSANTGAALSRFPDTSSGSRMGVQNSQDLNMAILCGVPVSQGGA